MAKLGRPKAEVVLTESERAELMRLTKRAHVNRAVAFRARVVLACADAPGQRRGAPPAHDEDAPWRSGASGSSPAGWTGLYDEPRVGAPRTVSDDAVEAVIVKTLETTPKGETHWSTRTMAKAAGMSHTMVGRIWRTFGLQPHVTESFKLSPDPQLVAKVRDVVGLYMHPPHNAVVFAVDEKSQIQALQRAQPILPMDIGQPERRTHNYIRHGTLDLFAALNVATGEVLARCKPQHRAQDFVAFLRDIDASVEAERGGPRRVGQPLRAQGAGGASLVAAASALPLPLHADLRVVAEPRGALLWVADRRRRSSADRTPASPSCGTRSSPTSRRTTNAACPSSGSRPPTRSSTRCADSDSACSRYMVSERTYPRNHRSRGLVRLCHIIGFPKESASDLN